MRTHPSPNPNPRPTNILDVYQGREDDVATLTEIAEEKRLSGSEALARLLHQRLVFEYYDEGGQRRADVPPAVRRVERVQRAIETNDS